MNLEDRKAALRAELEQLEKTTPTSASVEEAKLLTEYNAATGWPEPTPEDEEYAQRLGTQACVRDNGKITARLRTPRIIALERIARGEAPLASVPSTPSIDDSAPASGEAPRSGPGRPAVRQIVILEFAPDYDGPLKASEDNCFESAAEAARLLGVTPAAIYNEFKRQAGKPITIRGVTMQYLDVHVADDANFND